MKYIIFLILVAFVLGWSPWLYQSDAINLVDARIAELKQTEPDLCPMTADQSSIKKVPFGYVEKVEYDCTREGEIPEAMEASYNTVFITFYKGIIGMPKKTTEARAY
ncbi:MAG TPA: hypothetical protein VEA37_05070 [Flavobacterium sp.]|nr:hypothetical protein [Flavobacterium sp.]